MPRQHPWRKRLATRIPRPLFETNPLPMWIYDTKTLAFLDVNQTAIKLYGYSREEFLNQTLKNICDAQDLERLQRELTFPGPSPRYAESWKHYTKKRNALIVEVNASKTKWHGKSAAIVVAKDISQHSKARDEVFFLWQQHLQLQEIINHSPAVALMWKPLPDLPLTFISENISQFGYSREQFTKRGLLYSQIIHPEDLQHVVDQINHHARRQVSDFVQEYRILTAERETRWVEVRTWINRDIDGKVLGYSGVLLDISERRRAEERTHYQAALLKSVSDAIISTDLAFNILSWNPAAETILQWRESETIGKHWHALTNAQYLGQNASEIQRQINAIGYWNGLLSQKRKDGLAVLSDARISMVMDSVGQPAGIIIACRDITEKIKFEQSLSKSEQQYRAIFEQAAVGVSRTNIEGYFLDVNEKFCQITGYSRQELLGRSYKEITAPEDLQANDQIRDELQKKQTPNATIEKQYIRKEGSRTWVNLTLSYIEAGPDMEPFLLAITEDINLRKNQERELQALYEAGLALNDLKSPEKIAKKIIEILNTYLDWSHAGVWLREQGTEKIYPLACGIPPDKTELEEEIQNTQQRMIFNLETGLTGQAMRQAKTIRCNDVSLNPNYLAVKPGIKSGLYVPLISKGQAIGCIIVESQKLNRFSEYDERLLETLANQSTIAFENAGLLAAEQSRANQMQAIVQASQAISGNLDLPSLLNTIFQSAKNAIPEMERGTILLHGNDGFLHLIGAMGYFDPALLNLAIPDTLGYGAQAYQKKEGILVPDIQKLPAQKFFEKFEEVRQIQSAIAAPLIIKGKAIGVICLDNFTHASAFTENDLQLLTTFAASAAISIENARLFEQTQSRLAHILALRQIDNTINASADILVILNVILEKAREQLGIDAACILTFNHSSMSLEHKASVGFYRENISKTRFRIGEDLPAESPLSHKTLVIADLSAEIQRSKRHYLIDAEHFIVYGCAPMLAKGEVKGVLEVFSRAPLKTNPEWISFLEMLGGQAAIALENTQLYQDLQRSNLELMIAYDATIEGWAQALELRDEETEGHSRRVLELTLQLARRMGISGERLTHIRRGALLHDIGKMGIPDSILRKPGPLNKEEWAFMRQHPIRAYELMVKIPYLKQALEIPYSHHEKWDGSGYPLGLKGEQIPFAARIFAIVDVYDALTSNRPYRPAMSEADVIRYIQEQSGLHFDPQVVNAFLKMIDDMATQPSNQT